MNAIELVRALANRMREDEADAIVAYVSRLDQDDLEYYGRTGIDGLIRCIRGEYADFASGTPFNVAHPIVRI